MLAGALLLLTGIAQVVLPGIAASRIESTLLANATGVSVRVSAFPAVELLFGDAERITVHAREMRAGGHGSLQALLGKAASVERLDVTVDHMYVLGLRVDGVALHKRGRTITAVTTVSRRAIDEVLPANISMAGSQEGERSLRLTLRASVLGHRVSGSAQLLVAGGALRISPDIPILSLLSMTVFEDPQLAVTSIAMHTSGDRYTFEIDGTYR
ncbi:MAG: LmeA family phospholipid-binding protein [Solirubrobacteraceae bacterium]